MSSQVFVCPWGGGYLWSQVPYVETGISGNSSLLGVSEYGWSQVPLKGQICPSGGYSREWVCAGVGYAWEMGLVTTQRLLTPSGPPQIWSASRTRASFFYVLQSEPTFAHNT